MAEGVPLLNRGLRVGPLTQIHNDTADMVVPVLAGPTLSPLLHWRQHLGVQLFRRQTGLGLRQCHDHIRQIWTA